MKKVKSDPEINGEVLIISNKPADCKELAEILTNAGYGVIISNSGISALPRITDRMPVLFLLDPQLPDMDGFALCRLIREDASARRIPVILITGMDDELSLLNGFQEGAIDYIHRPFRPGEVLSRLQARIRFQRQETAPEYPVPLSAENKQQSPGLKDSEAEEQKTEIPGSLAMLSESIKKFPIPSLSEIYDLESLQPLIEEFHKLTGSAGAMVDISGKVLASYGWQDICTRFHRAHPESCDNCRESDTILTTGVPEGSFKAYHCKNNMWDMATPIMVDGHHLGNLFIGQYFYEGEDLDIEVFRQQAKKYGFDEEEYLAALGRVPRWSTEKLNAAMSFQARLAGMISSLSYSKFRLSHVLAQFIKTDKALKESEQLWRTIINTSPDGICITSLDGNIQFVSHKLYTLFGYDSPEEVIGRNFSEFLEESYLLKAATLIYEMLQGHYTGAAEYQLIKKDGSKLFLEMNAEVLPNEEGNPVQIFFVGRDITRRKQDEQRLREIEESMRKNNVLLHSILESPQGIIIFSLDLQYCYTAFTVSHKETMKRIWNIDIEVGMNMLSYIHSPEDREKARANFDRALQGEYFLVHEEYGQKELFRTFWEDRYAPIYDDNHVIIGLTVFVIDISERKKVEEALLISEERYRKLFDEATDGIMILDSAGRMVEANQAFADMHGYNIGEIQSMSLRDLDTPENIQQYSQKMTELISGSSIHFEAEHFHRDGHIFSLDIVANRLDLSGEKYILSFHRDLSERKKAEEALRQSEEKYRVLAENISDVIWTLNLTTGKFTYVSPSVYQLMGYTPEEVMQQGIEESLMPSSVEQVRKNLPLHFKEFLIDPALRKHYYDEHQQICKDGHSVWVETISQFITNKKGEIEVLGVSRNIQKRKIAEDELQNTKKYLENLINSANAPIVVWGSDFKITRFNQAFEYFSGYPAHEMIGKSIEILFPETSRNESLMLLTKTSAGTKWESVEIPMQHKSGKTKLALWNSANVYDENSNKLMATIAQGQDISERKQSEEALKRSEARLHELNATKDKFFSIIAHDMKSSFNSIIGFSDLLTEQIRENDLEGIEEYANIIQNSSERAMSLLMNLLEWSRSQTGRMEFNPEYIEMVSLINEVTALSDDYARQKSIRITMELQHNITLFADKDMISTIMRNLISNAIKFTHPGGSILISAVQKQKEITVSVKDNGVGIREEIMKKLFRIEESYSTSGTMNEKGTGLGLILCKEFVEKHKGTIRVESSQGNGSTFLFTLPKL